MSTNSYFQTPIIILDYSSDFSLLNIELRTLPTADIIGPRNSAIRITPTTGICPKMIPIQIA